MQNNSYVSDTVFVHGALAGTPAAAVSFPCCSSPSLPHCSDPLPPAELGFQCPTCCSLKMFSLQSVLATLVWGLEGNTLKPNKEQISAVDLSSSCSYIISLMLAIWQPERTQVGWLLARALVTLHISAITPVHCHKHHRQFKTLPQRCVTDASVFATAYEREANSLSLLWEFTILGCEQDHFLVFISAQALLKTVVKRCFFFFWTLDQARIPGRAPFFPHQADWHLCELMVTESKNLGRMKYQLTQEDTRAPLAVWMMGIFVDPVLFFLCVYSHNKQHIYSYFNHIYADNFLLQCIFPVDFR